MANCFLNLDDIKWLEVLEDKLSQFGEHCPQLLLSFLPVFFRCYACAMNCIMCHDLFSTGIKETGFAEITSSPSDGFQ